jgi:hypothetical protein
MSSNNEGKTEITPLPEVFHEGVYALIAQIMNAVLRRDI